MKQREDYKKLAIIHKALANEARLMIVDQLRNCECTVGELTEKLRLDQSTVSKHLSVLAAAGIVDYRKQGKNIYYCLLCRCILDMLTCTLQVIKERGG